MRRVCWPNQGHRARPAPIAAHAAPLRQPGPPAPGGTLTLTLALALALTLTLTLTLTLRLTLTLTLTLTLILGELDQRAFDAIDEDGSG